MVMVGQQRRLEQPLRWGRRERWAVFAIVAALILGAAVVVVYAITSSGGSSKAGCVEVTVPSTLGAAVVHSCGQDARNLCRQGTKSQVPVDALRAECARLHYAFGSPAQPAA